jgi:hypothetical protein
MEQGRIFAHRYTPFPAEETRRLMPNAPKFLDVLATDFSELDFGYMRGSDQNFTKIDGLMTPERHDLADILFSRLEDLLTEHSTVTRLASMSNVSDLVDDPRVREYTREERVANTSWIKMGAEIDSYKTIAKVSYTQPLSIIFPVVQLVC